MNESHPRGAPPGQGFIRPVADLPRRLLDSSEQPHVPPGDRRVQRTKSALSRQFAYISSDFPVLQISGGSLLETILTNSDAPIPVAGPWITDREVEYV